MVNSTKSFRQTERRTDFLTRVLSLLQMNQSKTTTVGNISLVLLAAKPGKLVGDHDVELCSTLHYLLALLCGHVMSDFSTVGPICRKVLVLANATRSGTGCAR